MLRCGIAQPVLWTRQSIRHKTRRWEVGDTGKIGHRGRRCSQSITLNWADHIELMKPREGIGFQKNRCDLACHLWCSAPSHGHRLPPLQEPAASRSNQRIHSTTGIEIPTDPLPGEESKSGLLRASRRRLTPMIIRTISPDSEQPRLRIEPNPAKSNPIQPNQTKSGLKTGLDRELAP